MLRRLMVLFLVFFFWVLSPPIFDSWEGKQQIHVLFRFLLAGIIDSVTYMFVFSCSLI